MDRQKSLLALLVTISGCFCVTGSVLILEGPSSVAIEQGGQVKLVCRVTGQGDELIRWFRIDQNKILSADAKILKRSLRKRYRIDGDQEAGEYSLVIRQVTYQDNGTFACGILSALDQRTIMSEPADLAVIQRPLCSIESDRQPSAPGSLVRLTCDSQNVGMGVQLSWHRPAYPHQVLMGAQGTNHTFISSHIDITLGPTDYGESFVCKESMDNPPFTRGCTVTPLEMDLPVILFPKQMQAVQGQNASFTCIIASKNSLSYEWYIDGYRDYSVTGDKYAFSPVTLANDNTRIECRTRDSLTGVTGNASSVIYVSPTNNPHFSTMANLEERPQPVPATKSVQPRVKLNEATVKPTPIPPAQDLAQDRSVVQIATDIPAPVTEINPIFKPTDSQAPVTKRPDATTTHQSHYETLLPPGVGRTSKQPSNIQYDPQGKSVLGAPGHNNKWSNMMVPILAVGSVIAVLLVCVIVVLLLFLVRQNRVAHGSMGGKEDSRKDDIHMDEHRGGHPGAEASPGNRTFNGDEEDTLHPKYFTLEPADRKKNHLQRTCSHTIVGDPDSEYNVLFRNASLRMPLAVKMNDYARPDSQIFDGDSSRVPAYAVTDVTVGGGTSSLKRSRSCVRPLPAAPIHQTIMNRSHYNIPRDTFNRSYAYCATDSSGDSVTIPHPYPLDSTAHSILNSSRSHVHAAFIPAGDEYAEIDSPPRPATPLSSDCSRPHSPTNMMMLTPERRSHSQAAMKELAASLASSYESGYDAASSDDVMDSESTSPYAAIDPSYRPYGAGTTADGHRSLDRTASGGATSAEMSANKPKAIPVYAKVKRCRAIQVDDVNIDNEHGENDAEEPQSEISC